MLIEIAEGVDSSVPVSRARAAVVLNYTSIEGVVRRIVFQANTIIPTAAVFDGGAIKRVVSCRCKLKRTPASGPFRINSQSVNGSGRHCSKKLKPECAIVQAT